MLVDPPYDRNAIASIEKAILTSDLGLNPSNDGAVIRLSFPQLTEERRKELIKIVQRSRRARPGRDPERASARQGRDRQGHEGRQGLRGRGHRAEKELQKLTDRFVAEIDDMLERKEHELSEV